MGIVATPQDFPRPAAPRSLSELKERLEAIMGKSLLELTREYGLKWPARFKMAKGFTGELIEYILGGTARNLPLPDFTHLSIELKTLPIDGRYLPLESTYICHLNLMEDVGQRFEDSALYRKTALMLFVAVEGSDRIEPEIRRVMGYYLYKPDREALARIRTDYEEVMEMVSLGHAHEINARMGEVVQVRPKGASGRDLVPYINEDGEKAYTRPRGFYFRASFTRDICKKMFPEVHAQKENPRA
ncbi:MAG TPA: hypothetical protein IAB18_02090 [Candidatus Avisuccinivibrio pullicola]|nr:hypothetical protein [Candidatus Avisuccinivibrio pullicola]